MSSSLKRLRVSIDYEKEQLAATLKGSLLEFTKTFYPLITGREFIVSKPFGRESHMITICREYTKLFHEQRPAYGKGINVPPGYGKSVLTCMFIAWCFAHYADCNFLYISYSHELASKHTAFIKQIMSSKYYQYLFDVHISPDSRAKDQFSTTKGGTVCAFGSQGGITGSNAGLPGQNRFSGCVCVDDAHKPEEVHSATTRATVIRNYQETILQRPRDENVPILFIGQRLHEDDLAAFLLSGNDVRTWDFTVLQGLDANGNALYPEAQSKQYLETLQEKQPYVFSSQIQQNPIPSGGALFKETWFILLDDEPEIIATFITADTAETTKSYNDATVFSMWGIYEIVEFGQKTGQYALHWLKCWEIRVEPKDLQSEFMSFYAEAMLHPVKPLLALIEKKSTGVTLISCLEGVRGLIIKEVKRTKIDGSKTVRFLEMQPIVAAKLISFTKGAIHATLCINHMAKITANDSHKNDDICFVAGTKIATKHGYKNIEDITTNDLIITPFGFGKVTASGLTKRAKVITNIGLEGTPNHPIFSGNNFKHLDTLSDGDSINKLSFMSILRWKYNRLLLSMEQNIDSWGRDAIILVSQKADLEKVLKACMLQFGNFIAERQYRKAMLFTIKTMTILTTTLKIWNAFQGHNILKTMQKIGKDGYIAKRIKSIFKRLEKKPKNGTHLKKVENGTVTMQELVLLSPYSAYAQYAMRNLSALNVPFIAQKIALTSNMLNEHAKNEQEKEVYNLTVEEFGVYYANDILVSNCDTLYDAVKTALIDKTLNINTKQSDAVAAMIGKQRRIINKARESVYNS